MRLAIKPVAVLLYSASATILLAGAVLLFMLLEPIDVLSNWHIAVQAGSHYPGETIAVDSHYTKLRNVTGRAFRYLDCKNSRGTYTRYAISNAPANNQAGKSRSTGVFIVIPRDIATPTTCHVSILVKYQVNAIRSQPEFTQSNEFQLVAAPTQQASAVGERPLASVASSSTASSLRVSPVSAASSVPAAQPSTSTLTTNTTNSSTTNSTSSVVPGRTCVSTLGLTIVCL